MSAFDVKRVGSSDMAVRDESDGKSEEAGSEWRQLLTLMRQYWPLLAITWTLHLGLGLSISLTGPTLPYLALNTRQTLSTAGFIYTARSIVVCVTCIGVGFLVARLRAGRAKLLLLLLGSCCGMIAAFLVPLMRSLPALILGQCLFGLGAGVVDTVDNMLVIFLFGPVLSRPLSHSLHFCVGIGGFLAPVLARPFLVRMGDLGSDVSICGDRGGQGGVNETATSTTIRPPVDLEPLKWPYVIVGCLHLLWIGGYCGLLLCRFCLHPYRPAKAHADADADADVSLSYKTPGLSTRRKALVIALFIAFYILHVGQENVFWSHLYAFAVCSRLRMSPGDASLLSTVFFLGFLVSRAIGIVAARLLPPARILTVELLGCLVTTVVLAAWGESSDVVAFVSVGLYGFFIAMLFPTGITWLASKMDVTGSLSSTWFVGAYIGNATYPLLAGHLIQASAAGAISMMHLAAATSGVYVVVVAVMFFVAK